MCTARKYRSESRRVERVDSAVEFGWLNGWWNDGEEIFEGDLYYWEWNHGIYNLETYCDNCRKAWSKIQFFFFCFECDETSLNFNFIFGWFFLLILFNFLKKKYIFSVHVINDQISIFYSITDIRQDLSEFIIILLSSILGTRKEI